MVVPRIPMNRQEWVRQLELDDWVELDEMQSAIADGYGPLIEAVKEARKATTTVANEREKIIGTVALLLTDSECLDDWIDGLSSNVEIPTQDEDWKTLFESAAWVVYRSHEQNLAKEASDGSQEA